MFTVRGENQRVPYTVEVDDDGTVRGSASVKALVGLAAGTEFALTPTGPYLTVDPTSPHDVYAVIASRTTVLATSGDVPAVDFGATGATDDERVY